MILQLRYDAQEMYIIRAKKIGKIKARPRGNRNRSPQIFRLRSMLTIIIQGKSERKYRYIFVDGLEEKFSRTMQILRKEKW